MGQAAFEEDNVARPEPDGMLAVVMARLDLQATQSAARLKTALELQRAGVAMMRQNLRRRFPIETEAEIQCRLSTWLQERPGAEFGDGVGRPVSWPRPSR
jgi:hypothetical protein